MVSPNECQVPTRRPLVLSGADSGFFLSLWQFLLSAERTGVSRTCVWRVYDLGFHETQLEQLRRRFQWCAFITFEFDRYPDHVRVGAGTYAWKPIIIADNLVTWDAPVFWFDSATILRTALANPLATVLKNGIWALKGKTQLAFRCDPRVLEALEVPTKVFHLPERVAGALGFNPAHPSAVQLALDWKRHALVRELVSPDNATRGHVQDQAVFNCLLLKAAAAGAIALTDDEVDISSGWPTKEISTRNKIAPDTPAWKFPLMRHWHDAYKIGDQLNHRWNHFVDTRLDGADRWRKEHFSVHIHDIRTGITHAIPSPRYGYYADPFVWQYSGRNWLFVEEFEYAKDQGRLVVMELDGALAPIQARPLTSTVFYGDFDCHASFPHVFEMNGTTCMIPETCGRRSVDLYVCEQWPDRWRLERRLLFAIDAADTMVLEADGLWWLVTSVQSGAGNRHLEIYFTDDLLKGTLHAHPINKSRLYEKMKYGTGRNAGYLARSSNRTIMRLMQKSQHFYGEGVSAMQVVSLNRESFEERPVEGIYELPVVTSAFSSHHVSRAGDLIAYDTRDRVR